MRKIANKLVYDTLEEAVGPRHPALLIVDMQNEFCSPEGVPGKNGTDVAPVRAIKRLAVR